MPNPTLGGDQGGSRAAAGQVQGARSGGHGAPAGAKTAR